MLDTKGIINNTLSSEKVSKVEISGMVRNLTQDELYSGLMKSVI